MIPRNSPFNAYVELADADTVVSAQTYTCARVPSTLSGTRTYTLLKPTLSTGGNRPAGLMIRIFRTKTANAHDVIFVEETSGRDLGSWDPSIQAWSDFCWDGDRWHMVGWDAGEGTPGSINDTSEP